MMKRMAVAALMMASVGAVMAQEKAAVIGPIAPPVTGLLVKYSYWPEQFVQFVGTELPYSMIELYVDATGKSPVYDAVLTGRESHKRVHYSNVQAVADAGKMRDGEGYLAKMDLERPDAAAVGATYTLKFTTHEGKPVEWRFVQGSDISERGSGLNPEGEIKVPVLAYREQGGLAGDGTALQVGDGVSVADVWKEVSVPPYFIAYHGAITEGSTIAVLAGGDEEWTVASAPTALTEGAAWKLTAADGRTRTLTIEKAAGNQYTIGLDDGGHAAKQTMDATHDASGWAIQRVHYVPVSGGEAHGFSVVFTPALTAAGESNVDFVVGKKTKIATASIVTAAGTVDVTMKSPEWAKGKEMVGTVAASADAVAVKIGPK